MCTLVPVVPKEFSIPPQIHLNTLILSRAGSPDSRVNLNVVKLATGRQWSAIVDNLPWFPAESSRAGPGYGPALLLNPVWLSLTKHKDRREAQRQSTCSRSQRPGVWFPALALRRNTDRLSAQRHYFQLMFHVVHFYNMGIITIFIWYWKDTCSLYG